ncbi:Cuticle protein [Homarus americanus]|uniref:Cuticle protein n=1 Tax=Homarus americanus TaxID=6706 RepID=A0A8J5JM99_HOMAM|nr:Cuticle protein [Homarus americanus]
MRVVDHDIQSQMKEESGRPFKSAGGGIGKGLFPPTQALIIPPEPEGVCVCEVRFTLPDGTLADVRYIADENGFRAESPLIPTPHPLPAHAVEQIRVAEEQRRRGIIWD